MVLVHRYQNSAAILYFLMISNLVSIQNLLAVNMSCRIMKPNNVVEREAQYFTNSWAVRILGGVSVAKRVAKSLGYDFRKKVS